MKILFAHNLFYMGGTLAPIHTYSRCMMRELRALGHDVVEVTKEPLALEKYKRFDLLFEVDCGRDLKGNESWHGHNREIPIPSVAYLIDSHGKPDLHYALQRNYTHVFFAVWDQRDLFRDHKSAHWCPNFTDAEHFNPKFKAVVPKYDFGFFGSKGGLKRADKLKEYANKNGWSYHVAQAGNKGTQRWPATAQAMGECSILFNHGQKHDDPNLRVMESMAMQLPLITPSDPRSGIGYLFEPWQDYIPYEGYSFNGLEKAMHFAYHKREAAQRIAEAAWTKVMTKHLTEHRIAQIMGVVE